MRTPFNIECKSDKMIVVVDSHIDQVITHDSDRKPFNLESAVMLASKMNQGNRPEYAHDAQVGIIRIISEL